MTGTVSGQAEALDKFRLGNVLDLNCIIYIISVSIVTLSVIVK